MTPSSRKSPTAGELTAALEAALDVVVEAGAALHLARLAGDQGGVAEGTLALKRAIQAFEDRRLDQLLFWRA
jgi:hypothetical protein